jgi:hypothetical protein
MKRADRGLITLREEKKGGRPKGRREVEVFINCFNITPATVVKFSDFVAYFSKISMPRRDSNIW